MNWTKLAIVAAATTFVVGCAQTADSGDAAGGDDTAEASDVERPEGEPAIGAGDNLLALSCADFLATAAIATAEEQDDAAIAAQDEIANGLIWLHGYLYASNNGEIDVLSQDWMKTNVERVYETCNSAENPAEVNLFEVAKS